MTGQKTGRQIVATVDGVPVSVAEVEAFARVSNETPRRALARLEAEQLLIAEAEKRGFSSDPEVELVAAQTAVQRLLIEQVEQSIRVSDEELEKAYLREIGRFEQPELRGSVHVLAKIARTADAKSARQAEALAREAIAAFSTEQDLESVLERFRQRKPVSFQVVAERLEPISRDANIAAEYKEALFGQPKPGAIEEPVRTSFGWHAIYLTEIQPAKKKELKEAADLLRPQLLQEKRSAEIRALISRARRSAKVRLDQSGVQWLMNADLSALFRQ